VIDILGFLRTEYKPGPGEFLEIDRQKLVDKLEIRARGRERGAAGLPSSTSSSLDEHETEICEAMRAIALAEERRTHDQLTLYQQRLQAADPQGSAADMNATATQSIAGFEAEVLAAKSALQKVRNNVRARQAAFDKFKEANHLDRPPAPPVNHALARGIIAVFFAIETAPNAILFGSGDELGVIGGYTIAIVFSILNLFFGYSVGRWGFTNLQHIKSWRKLMGAAIVLLCIFFAVVDNLAVALVREHVAMTHDTTLSLRLALDNLRAHEFAINDTMSIGLACLGLIFSFLSGLAGYKWEDPYPGYTQVSGHLDAADKAWTKAVEQRLTLLDGVQKKHADEIKAARSSLRDRQAAIPDILAQRARLVRNFNLHVRHLEGVGRYALSAYRDANRASRPSGNPAPDRFDDPWMLDGVEMRDLVDTPMSAPLDWQAANSALEASMTKLQKGYQAAIDEIRQLGNDKPANEAEVSLTAANVNAPAMLVADGRPS
jgi:hypothetical protein